jgi:hypothetical protein
MQIEMKITAIGGAILPMVADRKSMLGNRMTTGNLSISAIFKRNREESI